MKKVIGGLVLACVILRLAVVAGAGEALGAWARDMGVDSRAVMAALNVELGGLTAAAAGGNELTGEARRRRGGLSRRGGG